MALFCFLTRRACSRHVVLGEPVPQGSRVEAHLAACSECRRYWNDLRLLTRDLDRLVSVPLPSARYAEPIWDKVKPPVRARSWGRVTLASAAACGLLCGLIWQRFAATATAPLPGKQMSVLPGKPIAAGPEHLPVSPNPEMSRTFEVSGSAPAGHTVRTSPTVLRHRRRVRWLAMQTGEHSGRRSGRLQRGLRLPPDLRGVDTTDRLRASGLIYESQGDPGLANIAYQAAYERHPSAETAFDVGRSAEESGDLEQAMDVYAGLLESADAKTR